MSNVAYDKVTEAIIERLNAGVVPWRCPWSSIRARNIVGREYHGINTLILGSQGYKSPYWLTFKQAQALGGQVRKGSKATPVVFWKWLVRDDPDAKPGEISSKAKRIPFLRYYMVFNAEQCDGLTLPAMPEDAITPDPIAACDAVVAGYPNAPSIAYGGGSAFYRPSTDSVQCPDAEHFDSMEGFYDTLFHELAHSTGHASRLARQSLTATAARFGSDPYAREELVAEMGAAFLCHHAGIDAPAIVDNEAAYIASWLGRLKNDHKLIVVAAAQGRKAADHILNVKYNDAPTED